MSRNIVLIITVIIVSVSVIFSDGMVGASSQCVNGRCLVGGGSSIFAMFIGLILGGFALWFPRKEFIASEEVKVSIWRRIVAMFVDFYALMMVVTPFLAMPLLIIESQHTGEFAWNFVREYQRESDTFAILPVTLLMLVLMISFFYISAKKQTQTLGQYILNIKLKPPEGVEVAPSYGQRFFLFFIGLCMWPISLIIALRNERKAFWWDNQTNIYMQIGS